MILKVLAKIKNRLFPSRGAKRVSAWIKANGDQLRFIYPSLDETSIIFDLGGYKGEWTSDIYSRYRSNVYVFEPYKVFAKLIAERFSKNNQIQVFPYGLGKKNSIETLQISENSSSTFGYLKNAERVEIEIVKAADFFTDHNIDRVDLMKINIEGGEYDLLEGLIDNGLVTRIKNIQVQFHHFVPDAYTRMKSIQHSLAKTHTLTFQHEFVWENWALNE